MERQRVHTPGGEAWALGGLRLPFRSQRLLPLPVRHMEHCSSRGRYEGDITLCRTSEPKMQRAVHTYLGRYSAVPR